MDLIGKRLSVAPSFNQKIMPLLCVTTLVIVFNFAEKLAAQESDQQDSATRQFQSPVLLEMDPPIFPLRELSDRIEGWAVVEFCVTEEGRVRDAKIHSQTGPDAFGEIALKTVAKGLYEPALLNGKPVLYCDQKQQVNFALPGEPGASPKFVRAYKKANAAIIARDLKEAQEQIEKLSQRKNLNLYEHSWINFARALVAIQEDNAKDALDYFEKSLYRRGKYLELETAAIALYYTYMINYQMQRYGDALAAYSELKRFEKKPDNYELVEQSALALLEQFSGNNKLAVPLVLDENGEIEYRLSRAKVSLQADGEDVTGEAVELACRLALKDDEEGYGSTVFYQRYPFELARIWEVETASKTCTITVSGQPGLKLTLIQHPG